MVTVKKIKMLEENVKITEKEADIIAKSFGFDKSFLFGKKATGGNILSGAAVLEAMQIEELKHWQKNAAILIKKLVKDKFPELDEIDYKIVWGDIVKTIQEVHK